MSTAQALRTLVGRATSEKLLARFGTRGIKKLAKGVASLENLSENELETLEILGDGKSMKVLRDSEADIANEKLCPPRSIL